MDDKAIDGQHRLVAKISDPDAKKSRQGATSEGRELFIGNVDNTASEQEIRDEFSKHGKVETVRMIRGVHGNFIGTCFIVFSTAVSCDFDDCPLRGVQLISCRPKPVLLLPLTINL